MEKSAKIYVAGHRGMVGSAIVRELNRQGYHNIITRTHAELDLCRQDQVEKFFEEEKPDVVINFAAESYNIAHNIGSSAEAAAGLGDLYHRHRSFRRNTLHRTPDVTVDHQVTDHCDPAIGKSV